MRLLYDQRGVQVWCGDVLRAHEAIREPVGAVLTDPPYSSGGAFRGDRMASTVSKYVQSGCQLHRPDFTGDNRDQRGYLAWSALWMDSVREASLPGSPLLCFTDWRQLPITTDAIQAGGWVWRAIATWHKPGVRMQRGRFSGSAEYIVVGSNGPVTEGPTSPQNVFTCQPTRGADKTHIAEKPVPVLRWLLGIVPDGATVLDPFCGSGNTGIAARAMGLRAILIDKDPACCEVAIRALEQQAILPGLEHRDRDEGRMLFADEEPDEVAAND